MTLFWQENLMRRSLHFCESGFLLRLVVRMPMGYGEPTVAKVPSVEATRLIPIGARLKCALARACFPDISFNVAEILIERLR